MPRSDRSRSPTAAERISRTVAGFGRYPDKRPRGLKVDVNGALRLDDLMATWGERAGFTSNQVLHAIRRHMFHDGEDGTGSSALRFAIDSDVWGGIVIKVLPKRIKGEEEKLAKDVEQRPTPCATPARTRGLARPRQVGCRQVRGSVLQALQQQDLQNAKEGDDDTPAPKAAPRKTIQSKPAEDEHGADAPSASRESKLDMSLDEVIQREGRAPTPGKAGWTPPPLPRSDAPSAISSFNDREARVRHRLDQMGLTVASTHRRGGGERAERVSRYISWILQNGYKTVDVELHDGGWVRLDALATAMTKHRPSFGDFDGAKLQEFLERTDVVGRFEIDAEGRIRKVPKGARRPREPGAKTTSAGEVNNAQPRRPEPGAERAASSGASSSRSARRQNSVSRSPSPAPAAACDDEALAEACQSSLRVNGAQVTVVEATEVEAAALEAAAAPAPPEDAEEPGRPPRPQPPPGEGWTLYQDNGVNWWHYEGPLGQFWCQDKSTEILPYGESSEAVVEDAAEP